MEPTWLSSATLTSPRAFGGCCRVGCSPATAKRLNFAVITGRATYIVEKISEGKETRYQLWFDKETLLLLKSDIYVMDADGNEQLYASQECVQVSYDVEVDEDLFTMPAVPGANVTHIIGKPASQEVINRLKFVPLGPTELPDNFIAEPMYVVMRTVSDIPEENTVLVSQSLRPESSDLGNLVIQQYAVGTPVLTGSSLTNRFHCPPPGSLKTDKQVDVNGQRAELISLWLPRQNSEGMEEVWLLEWTQEGVKITMQGKSISEDTFLAIAKSMRPVLHTFESTQ